MLLGSECAEGEVSAVSPTALIWRLLPSLKVFLALVLFNKAIGWRGTPCNLSPVFLSDLAQPGTPFFLSSIKVWHKESLSVICTLHYPHWTELQGD